MISPQLKGKQEVRVVYYSRHLPKIFNDDQVSPPLTTTVNTCTANLLLFNFTTSNYNFGAAAGLVYHALMYQTWVLSCMWHCKYATEIEAKTQASEDSWAARIISEIQKPQLLSRIEEATTYPYYLDIRLPTLTLACTEGELSSCTGWSVSGSFLNFWILLLFKCVCPGYKL